MPKRILLIQGHPDASQLHLCHALASSYNAGAESAGHSVRHVNVAKLDFPLLRSSKDLLLSGSACLNALGQTPSNYSV